MSDHIPLIYSDKDSNTLHRGRVSLAHEILSGIPEELIQLDHFYAPGQSSWTDYCNTIACGAGWLALHPAFQNMGLRPRIHEWERSGVEFIERYTVLKGFDALAAVFVVGDWLTGDTCVRNMFSEYSYGDWDHVLLKLHKAYYKNAATDRDLLLMRLRYAYQHHCGHDTV